MMFTGIVEAVGVVTGGSDGIEVSHPLGSLDPGSSIAVNGVCLTVTHPTSTTFAADVSEETASLTTLGSLQTGSRVNLERPMPADGRFGGHVVQGHVDGMGKVERVEVLVHSTEVEISIPPHLLAQCVTKGSITVDGVSLTIASLTPFGVVVSLIPHTLESTILGGWGPGVTVNIETDVIAKYVQRLINPVPVTD